MPLPPTLAALALLAPALFADVRDPVLLHAEADGSLSGIVTDGDLSAALFRSTTSEDLAVRLSDGRGLTWSAPVPIDAPGTDDFINAWGLRAHGGDVYVLWADDRNYQVPLWPMVASTPFLTIVDGATGTAGPTIPLPLTALPEHTSANARALAVTEHAGAVHLHVATHERTLDPVTGVISNRIVLDSSHNGAANWLPRKDLTPPGGVVWGYVAVLAEGMDVHVIWDDETSFAHSELFHQRSSDGGQTLDFAAPKVVPGSYDVVGYDVDLAGSTLAFALRYLAPDFAFSWTGLFTSSDRGDTYNAGTSIAAPSVSVDQSFEARIELVDGGARVTAIGTASDFSGGNHVIAVHSPDGGQTWSPGQVLHSGPGKQVNVVAAGPGRERAVATWLEGSGFAGSPRAAVSLDGGATFATPLSLAGFPGGAPRLAWNDLYQNLIAGLVPSSAPKDTFVGGLRPQAITPGGFAGGSSSVDVTFEAFDGGADLGWLLLSDSEAGLPLGDGRDLGLGLSPLLLDSLHLAIAGPFAAVLSPAGAGALGPVPVPAPGVPAGLTLYAVGVGLDLGTLSIVDVSDVVRLDT